MEPTDIISRQEQTHHHDPCNETHLITRQSYIPHSTKASLTIPATGRNTTLRLRRYLLNQKRPPQSTTQDKTPAMSHLMQKLKASHANPPQNTTQHENSVSRLYTTPPPANLQHSTAQHSTTQHNTTQHNAPVTLNAPTKAPPCISPQHTITQY